MIPPTRTPNATWARIDEGTPDLSALARQLFLKLKLEFYSCRQSYKFPHKIVMSRRGYTGDALRVCTRGECFHDDECPNHLACFDYQVYLIYRGREREHDKMNMSPSKSISFSSASSSFHILPIQIVKIHLICLQTKSE